MDTFERNATRTLAVAYHAYMSAGPDNWQVWAKLLIQAQRDTGVELLPVSTLLYHLPHKLVEAVNEIRMSATKEADAYFAAELGDGGALVPAPKPPPRKPSPGASVAMQAVAFYGRAGR